MYSYGMTHKWDFSLKQRDYGSLGELSSSLCSYRMTYALPSPLHGGCMAHRLVTLLFVFLLDYLPVDHPFPWVKGCLVNS